MVGAVVQGGVTAALDFSFGVGRCRCKKQQSTYYANRIDRGLADAVILKTKSNPKYGCRNLSHAPVDISVESGKGLRRVAAAMVVRKQQKTIQWSVAGVV